MSLEDDIRKMDFKNIDDYANLKELILYKMKKAKEELDYEINAHLTGKCGVSMCEECRELNDGQDICLEELKNANNNILGFGGKEKA